jgi:uncharacterized protein YlxW (UPF0749 family)
MLAVQFKTTENYENSLVTERVEDLTRKLNTVTEERDVLAKEVLSLRDKLNNVRENDEAMADLQEELQNANMAAGLIPVEGPGVILTLDDSKRSLQPGENPNNLLVHEKDILNLVNEFKTSGAEAVSVNDQRITALSEIRCAGTTILVNWNKIGPPFVIKAIGDPDMLESGLSIRGGRLEMLKALGIQISIKKSENVEIPGYTGMLMNFRYSVPVEYKEKAEE